MMSGFLDFLLPAAAVAGTVATAGAAAPAAGAALAGEGALAAGAAGAGAEALGAGAAGTLASAAPVAEAVAPVIAAPAMDATTAALSANQGLMGTMGAGGAGNATGIAGAQPLSATQSFAQMINGSPMPGITANGGQVGLTAGGGLGQPTAGSIGTIPGMEVQGGLGSGISGTQATGPQGALSNASTIAPGAPVTAGAKPQSLTPQQLGQINSLMNNEGQRPPPQPGAPAAPQGRAVPAMQMVGAPTYSTAPRGGLASLLYGRG